LLYFYRLLYRYQKGQGVAMPNWLRKSHAEFGKTPHLLLVDDHRLKDVITYLQAEVVN